MNYQVKLQGKEKEAVDYVILEGILSNYGKIVDLNVNDLNSSGVVIATFATKTNVNMLLSQRKD